jgi:hypothetical protein
MDLKPVARRLFGDQIGQHRIPRIFESEILDHVRSFVAGVTARVPLIGIDVKAKIREPMGIKDKECIGAPVARPFADFLQRLDGKRAPAFQGAFALRQQQRGHVGDFGGKHDLAHGVSCDGVSCDCHVGKRSASIDPPPLPLAPRRPGMPIQRHESAGIRAIILPYRVGRIARQVSRTPFVTFTHCADALKILECLRLRSQNFRLVEVKRRHSA